MKIFRSLARIVLSLAMVVTFASPVAAKTRRPIRQRVVRRHVVKAPVFVPTPYSTLNPGWCWNPRIGHLYFIDPYGATPQDLDNVHNAFWQVSTASGIRFTFGGYTSDHSFDWRVVVQWTTPEETQYLPPGITGSAQPLSPNGFPSGPSGEYTSGSVLFLRGVETQLGVALHEIGHILGLGHISHDGVNTMGPPAPNLSHYGPGDLRGLQAMGQVGCV